MARFSGWTVLSTADVTFQMVGLLPTVVAAAILVGYGETASTHKAACVFATFISGTFGTALSIVYAWNATNIGGSSKKAAVYAANMFSFAAGNIAGSFTFRDQEYVVASQADESFCLHFANACSLRFALPTP